MRYFFGCIIAAAAGIGVVNVPNQMFYEHPELFLTGVLDIFQ